MALGLKIWRGEQKFYPLVDIGKTIICQNMGGVHACAPLPPSFHLPSYSQCYYYFTKEILKRCFFCLFFILFGAAKFFFLMKYKCPAQ